MSTAIGRVFAATFGLSVCTAALPCVTPADLAYNAVVAAFERKPLDPVSTLYVTLGYYLDFPDDERAQSRLRNILWMESIPERQKPGSGPSVEEKRAYRVLLKQRLAAALTVPGLKDEVRMTLRSFDLEREIYDQELADKPDVAAVRAAIDDFRAQYPQAYEGFSEQQYMQLLEKVDPAAVEPFLKALTQRPSPGNMVATMAQGQLNRREAMRTPVEMKFTALDGRKVDLKKMRGKVVMIDFWSTSCGPCIAEFPHVKKVYAEYKSRGFEVIGVAMDGESAKQKLLGLIEQHALPWPQHYDGAATRNVFGAKYGVLALPTVFLLDKSGRLAAQDMRGEKLEVEVKRLLAL